MYKAYKNQVMRLPKKRKCCPVCRHPGLDLGRAHDNRSAFRCQKCGNTWLEGSFGTIRKYTDDKKRCGQYQFYNTRKPEYSDSSEEKELDIHIYLKKCAKETGKKHKTIIIRKRK